jgi:hypothetical protein
MSATLPKEHIPAKVAATRARIARAAVKCDYAALQRIANESPQGFRFSFGAEKSAAAYWRKLETTHRDKPMRRLLGILKTPFTRNEIKDYAWPSTYTEKPTAAGWRALVRSGAYTSAEVARLRTSDMYLGYRTAIGRPRGTDRRVRDDPHPPRSLGALLRRRRQRARRDRRRGLDHRRRRAPA